jgi:hypothetical protein
MLSCVAIVIADVSEDRISSIVRAIIEELGTSEVTSKRSTLRWLVIANIPSSPILVTPMIEAVRFSET